jgi:hypothetical protein
MFQKTSWLVSKERVWWVCWKWKNACMFYRYQSYHWGTQEVLRLTLMELDRPNFWQGVGRNNEWHLLRSKYLQNIMVDIRYVLLLWINTLVQKFNKWTKTSSPKKSKQLKKENLKVKSRPQQQYCIYYYLTLLAIILEYVFVDKKILFFKKKIKNILHIKNLYLCQN